MAQAKTGAASYLAELDHKVRHLYSKNISGLGLKR